MIKRLSRTKFDIENLSKLRTLIPNGIDNFDYKKIVVNKPWGYEYLLFDNRYVAIWILYLKEGCATSMHCHPNKKTSLITLWGEVVCSTLDGWVNRVAGQGAIIEEAVFHSSKAASSNGAFIMEIESPPNKKDLVRLKDGYGREGHGYEGKDMMTNSLSQYEYIDFHDDVFKTKKTKKIKNCSLSLFFHKNKLDIQKRIIKESKGIICLLQGKLHDHEGKIILSTGEATSISEIKAKEKIFAFSDLLFLLIQHDEKKSKII